MRLGIPTKGKLGLKDRVSEVFGKAPTFTIIEWDVLPQLIEVIDNPAIALSQGVGPIATKLLKEKGVEIVLCGDVGIGVSIILSGYGIKYLRVEPCTLVSEAVTQIEDLWKI